MLQSKATLGKRLPYGNLTGAERLHPPGIHVCMACDKLIRTPGADNDRGPSADIRSTTGKIAAMKNKAMIRMMVLVISIGTLSLTVARPSLAQNGIGGPAKTKQNAIGGASKPAPVIGGTAISAPAVTKPAVVGSMTKPASGVGAGKGGSIGNATAGLTAAAAKQSPPVNAPNKATTVVTTSSNLKCGGGACVARVTKP